MDVREALYTTRAMRRVKPDPIPMDAQLRILDAAVRAPSGGNTQNWRFLLVDSHLVKAELAPIYQQAIAGLWSNYYKDRIDAAHADPETPESKSMLAVQKSAQWLADHFEEVPLFLFGFTQHDTSGSSIYPALWSAQLAARAEGIGTSLTQALAFFNDETLRILGVPEGEGWHMAGCVTFGYPTGRWGVAARQPAREVSFRNRWGAPSGFDVDGPLWAPEG
jgi:nitroreductase